MTTSERQTGVCRRFLKKSVSACATQALALSNPCLSAIDNKTRLVAGFVVDDECLSLKQKKLRKGAFFVLNGAGNGIRTHDINLGKVALYP